MFYGPHENNWLTMGQEVVGGVSLVYLKHEALYSHIMLLILQFEVALCNLISASIYQNNYLKP